MNPLRKTCVQVKSVPKAGGEAFETQHEVMEQDPAKAVQVAKDWHVAKLSTAFNANNYREPFGVAQW